MNGVNFDPAKPWAGMVPVDSVVRNPEQPRTEFPAAELEALAVALRAGQAQPCTVIPHEDAKMPKVRWMLVDGECRWRAAMKSGMGELFVCYKPGVTRENLHRVSFASNFCRLSHTKEETARAIDKEYKAGQTYEQIAAMVGKSAPWAVQMHQLLKLHPMLLKFMDEPDPATNRKLGIKVALLMVGQEPERQLATYLKVRSKTTAEQYHQVRRTAVVKSDRSPADDFAYMTGLLSGALGRMMTLGNVGEVMLRRFSRERIEELRGWVARIQSHCGTLDARLDKFERLADSRSECQVWPVLLVMMMGWSEGITGVLGFGLAVFLGFVGLLWLAEALLSRVAGWLARCQEVCELRRALWVPVDGPAPAPTPAGSPYTLLSKEEMEMLLVNAGLMASRRIQEDGCGLVKASVLGWSWKVSPLQMSVFLAWCRGKSVETPDGRRWTAFVKVGEEWSVEVAWVVFRPMAVDGATVNSERCDGGAVVVGEGVSGHRSAFEEALERSRKQLLLPERRAPRS